MKYGWIAFVTMMVALLSTTQVAAQDPYGPEEIGAEESPVVDPDLPTDTDLPQSELDKIRAMDADSETPTVVGARPVSASTPAKVGQAGMGTEASERDSESTTAAFSTKPFMKPKCEVEYVISCFLVIPW